MNDRKIAHETKITLSEHFVICEQTPNDPKFNVLLGGLRYCSVCSAVCAVQCAQHSAQRVHTCVLRTISHDTLAIRAIMHASPALEGFSVINNYLL